MKIYIKHCFPNSGFIHIHLIAYVHVGPDSTSDSIELSLTTVIATSLLSLCSHLEFFVDVLDTGT